MKLILMILCATLIGCGGSGGGSSAPSTSGGTVTPPPPPPPPPLVVYQTDGLVYSDTTTLGVPGLVLEYWRTTVGTTAYFDVKIHNTSSSNYLYEAWNQILMHVPNGYGDVDTNGVRHDMVNMIIGYGISFTLNAGASLNVAATSAIYTHIATVPASMDLTPTSFHIIASVNGFDCLPYFTPVGNG